MTVSIHPTAIIDPKAQIGAGVSIGAYSVIHEGSILHDGVTLHSHVVVEGGTEIGADTEIFPFAVLGKAPQHLKYAGEPSTLVIGARNVIREHVTMHRGTAVDKMTTTIGDDGFFMVGSHIAHDCVVGNNAIFANGVGIGGHVEIGNYVTMGGFSAVHQFVRIGDFAMVGGNATVLRDVIPYGIVSGEQAYLNGLNLVGLKRRGFDKDARTNLRDTYKALFEGEGTFDERLQLLSAQDHSETVQTLLEFIKAGNARNLCQPEMK